MKRDSVSRTRTAELGTGVVFDETDPIAVWTAYGLHEQRGGSNYEAPERGPFQGEERG